MHSDAEVEVHRVPHRAQLALTQTDLAVVEAIDATRRYSVAAPPLFNHFCSLVAFFAWVDDDFFTPFFTCTT